MPYNFALDGFYTNKGCSRLSLSEVHVLTENGHVLSPLIVGLGATYAVYLRLIGKHIPGTQRPQNG